MPLWPHETDDVSESYALARQQGHEAVRISLGVHSFGTNTVPASFSTRRKPRRTLCESNAVPTSDANTRLLSFQRT